MEEMRPHGKKSKVDRILKLKRIQGARLIIFLVLHTPLL